MGSITGNGDRTLSFSHDVVVERFRASKRSLWRPVDGVGSALSTAGGIHRFSLGAILGRNGYSQSVNAAVSYTVVLTKGAHIVPNEDAVAIQNAIEFGQKLVNVRFEESPALTSCNIQRWLPRT